MRYGAGMGFSRAGRWAGLFAISDLSPSYPPTLGCRGSIRLAQSLPLALVCTPSSLLSQRPPRRALAALCILTFSEFLLNPSWGWAPHAPQ